MKNNQLVCLLVPTLALALPADIQGWADGDNGNGIVVGVGESTTSPGGFSAVAEPAGPVDPEAAKRATEEYAQKCILPQVEVLMTMGIAPGQQDSHHHRDLVAVKPLHCRLLRHHTISLSCCFVRDFHGTNPN